jgi:hypothetical protein
MRRLRSHLVAVAIATLALHAGAVSFGALRPCWATEHRHAGVPVDDCVMHHRAASGSGGHAHHAHGGAASPTGQGGEQVSCSCSNDVSTPYVGPAAVIGPIVGLQYVVLGETVTPQDYRSPSDVRIPPFSPPPRSIFSTRS